MDAKEFQSTQERARNVICAAGIKLTDDEAAHIEVADFGLNRLASEGLELAPTSITIATVQRSW